MKRLSVNQMLAKLDERENSSEPMDKIVEFQMADGGVHKMRLGDFLALDPDEDSPNNQIILNCVASRGVGRCVELHRALFSPLPTKDATEEEQ
jgi:hypothetical protein